MRKQRRCLLALGLVLALAGCGSARLTPRAHIRHAIWDIVVKILDALLARPDRLSGSVLAVAGMFAIVEASHLPFGTLRAPDAGTGFGRFCAQAVSSNGSMRTHSRA